MQPRVTDKVPHGCSCMSCPAAASDGTSKWWWWWWWWWGGDIATRFPVRITLLCLYLTTLLPEMLMSTSSGYLRREMIEMLSRRDPKSWPEIATKHGRTHSRPSLDLKPPRAGGTQPPTCACVYYENTTYAAALKLERCRYLVHMHQCSLKT